jgi:hypothetical protein
MKFALILRKITAGAVLLAAISTAAHAQLTALFLGSYSLAGIDAARTDILGSDVRFDLGNSASFNWSTGNLPTLAALLQYDAVLAWTDASYSSAMSNLLADYVDAGGGVVIATFWGQEVDGIAGGGRLETTGYNPLVNSTFDAYSGASLGTHDASSPLFNGVNALSATNYRGDYLPGLDAGATLAGSWSDGKPLIAFNAAHNVVNLTLTPTVASLGHATGDYQQLFRNSLAFVGDNRLVPVPEPSTYGIGGALALGVLVFLRRRK